MPLDPRKAHHMQQVVARSWQGRQRSLVVVARTGSGYSYTTIQGIMRRSAINDPQIRDAHGGVPVSRQSGDAILILPPDTNLQGAVYIADTPTPTLSAISSANKYQIIEALPIGMETGGSHLHITLRRMQ